MGDRQRDRRAEGRRVRIAAVGDLHFHPSRRGALTELFASANHDADILLLCGDMTNHGQPETMRAFVQELSAVEIPILAVLGNHDHEGERVDELTDILRDRGVNVLDGEARPPRHR